MRGEDNEPYSETYAFLSLCSGDCPAGVSEFYYLSRGKTDSYHLRYNCLPSPISFVIHRLQKFKCFANCFPHYDCLNFVRIANSLCSNIDKEKTLKAKQLLIVDDSEIIQQRLSDQLSDIQGIKILNNIGSISDAISAFNKYHPDIVILDIQLADGQGFEVLDVIKKKSPKTIVIMFTNYAQSAFRKRSLEHRADFFIDKSNGYITIYDFVRWFSRDRSAERVTL